MKSVWSMPSCVRESFVQAGILVLSLFLFVQTASGTATVSFIANRCLVFVIPCLMACGWLVAGELFFSKLIGDDGLRRIVFSLILGWGVMSAAAMLIGWAGCMSQLTALIFVIVPPLLGWRRVLRAACFVVRRTAALMKEGGVLPWIICSIAALAAVNILLSVVPCLDYDVLEYHLGVPFLYVKRGGVGYVNNVYGLLPQTVEMTAYICLSIFRDQILGSVCAKVIMTILLLVLTGCGYSFARMYYSVKTAALCAAVMCFMPWTVELSRTFYVEIGLAAVFLAALSVILKAENDGKQVFLGGVLAGLAVTIKYSALILVVPPLLIFLLKKKHTVIASFAGGILVFSLPWLLRDFVLTGNPLYPLCNELFHSPFMSRLSVAQFRYAHLTKGYSLIGLTAPFIGDSKASPFVLYLTVGYLGAVLWKETARKAVAAVGLFFLFWVFFTHGVDRFAYPGLCAVVLLGGWVIERFPGKMTETAVTVFFVWQIWRSVFLILPGAYDVALGLRTIDSYMSQHYPPHGAESYINKQAAREPMRVLMVGECRTYYISAPVVEHTVFDRNFMEDVINRTDIAGSVEMLCRNGITHIYVNWDEIRRLRENYRFMYKGEMVPGYFRASLDAFKEFLETVAYRVFPDGEDLGIEVYKLKQNCSDINLNYSRAKCVADTRRRAVQLWWSTASSAQHSRCSAIGPPLRSTILALKTVVQKNI